MEAPKKIVIDVEPTVTVILDMADTLNRYSRELKAIARKMETDGDISRASEALTCITNCVQNLRLDLLVTRPIREFDRSMYIIFNAKR